MWSSDFNPSHPPLTDALVAEMEALLGVALPPAYVELMRQQNGGYLDEQMVAVEDDVPAGIEGYLDQGYASIGSIAGINPDPEADNSISNTPYMTREWSLPEGLVLLDGDGHTWVALDYREREEDPPVIYIVADSGEHVTIARDFAHLLEKMVPFEDVFDEDGDLRED